MNCCVRSARLFIPKLFQRSWHSVPYRSLVSIATPHCNSVREMSGISSNTSNVQCTMITADESGISEAAAMLKSGKCVAFPTETVYGLGANALDESAVKRIFEFKGRPLTSPLIVHLSTPEKCKGVLQLTPETEKAFDALAAAFWPGPLTIVARAAACIPLLVTAGTGFVGVRIPSHPLALSLLAATGLPIAAPSANRFGHVSPTKAVHVKNDLGNHPIGILIGEATGSDAEKATCGVGIESTVLKVDVLPASDSSSAHAASSDDRDTSPVVDLTVYRKGGVSTKQLQEALHAAGFHNIRSHFNTLHELPAAHESTSAASHATDGSAPSEPVVPAGTGAVAPGMLLTHYAPDVSTYLVSTVRIDDEAAATTWPDAVGVDLSTAVIIDFGGRLSGFASLCLAYQDMSPSGDILAARARLFDVLRWSELVEGATKVLIADLEDESQEHVAAVRDRVFRAASGRVMTCITTPAHTRTVLVPK